MCALVVRYLVRCSLSDIHPIPVVIGWRRHHQHHVLCTNAFLRSLGSFPAVLHQDTWSRDLVWHPSRDGKVDSIINRYYDPTTDQFLSIDPDVAQTDQPYMFTNDNPLNTEDPLGEDPMLLGNPNQYPDQTVPIATVYSSGPIALTWMNSDGGGDAQLADGYSGTGGPAPAAGPGSEGTGGDGPDQTVHGEEQSADPSRLSKSPS